MRTLTSFIVVVVALAGCVPELPERSPETTPPSEEYPACEVPAEPLAAAAYTVYLNTEGVTLHLGPCDDARTNCTNLAASVTTVVPPFLADERGRERFISSVVRQVREVLAPYSVDVVTTRPSSGDYEMIVLGGDPVPTTLGCEDCRALAMVAGCGLHRDNRSRIALVFDRSITTSTTGYANTILGEIGNLVDLASTKQAGDCMCRPEAGCTSESDELCRFGSRVPVADDECAVESVQDGPQLLAEAFFCR